MMLYFYVAFIHHCCCIMVDINKESREMSKPNRVMAHLPKRPFELDKQFPQGQFGNANAHAAELAAQGFDSKVTRMRLGKGFVHNVWKREKEVQPR
jgi:hypothetical protein